MISREDVTAAYRLFLSREPVNQAVVDAAVDGYRNIEKLSDAFHQSDEFAKRITPLILARRFPHDLNPGSEQIDVHCDPASVRELLQRVEQTWTRLGKEDPYWSVLTDD